MNINDSIKILVQKQGVTIYQGMKVFTERFPRVHDFLHAHDQRFIAAFEEMDRQGIFTLEKLIEHRVAVSCGCCDIPEAGLAEAVANKQVQSSQQDSLS